MLFKKFLLSRVNLGLFNEDEPQGSDDLAANASQQTNEPDNQGEEMVEYEGIQIPKRLLEDSEPATPATTKTETTETDPANTQAENKEIDLDKFFETLSTLPAERQREVFDTKIKDMFKDQISTTVQKQFDRRFKDYKTLETQAAANEQRLNSLLELYGVDTIEELDDVLAPELAAAAGFSDVKSFEKARKDAADAEKYRKMNEKPQKQTNTQTANEDIDEIPGDATEVIENWNKEADELKKSYPTFDLQKEVAENQKFADYLEKGYTVREAYVLTNHETIVKGLSQKADKTVKSTTAKQSNANRPLENGVQQPSGVVVNTNDIKRIAATLTPHQFNEAADQLASGKIKTLAEYKPSN